MAGEHEVANLTGLTAFVISYHSRSERAAEEGLMDAYCSREWTSSFSDVTLLSLAAFFASRSSGAVSAPFAHWLLVQRKQRKMIEAIRSD